MPLDSTLSLLPTAAADVPCAATAFHRRLAEWHRVRATSVFDAPDWLTSLSAQYRMRRLEHDYVAAATASVRALAREAPSHPERFSPWFARLDQLQGGVTSEFFDRLAHSASADQLRRFLRQRRVADAAVSELSALTQRNLTPPELSIMPGPAAIRDDPASDPFARLERALSFAPPDEDIVWEALAVSNLMVAFAANRRYAYQAAGALAVIERTAPEELSALESGVRRTGIPSETLTTCLGGSHGWSWGRDGVPALVAHDPSAASQIAEGALARLAATTRYVQRCGRELDQSVETQDSERPHMLLQAVHAPEAPSYYAN